MHRFFLPSQNAPFGPALRLDEREAHHAVGVLRIRPGERVTVLDGAGREYLCEVKTAARRDVELRVVQKIDHAPLPGQITLAQAILKGKAMDLVIQKATELGVTRLVPIMSERSVSQIDRDQAADKVDKWRDTAVEAMKQSGWPWLPRIDTPVTPQAFLAGREQFDLTFIASLQPDARHPRRYFTAFQAEHKRSPQSICVWVGPEGDFTPAEINTVKSAGALPITLGKSVLRSETAAIYCLSTFNYELQAPEPGEP